MGSQRGKMQRAVEPEKKERFRELEKGNKVGNEEG